MISANSFLDLLSGNCERGNTITYLSGDREPLTTSFDELKRRALITLFELQSHGARPGDFLILVVTTNQAFLEGFWAAVLGGLVPVPVAAGTTLEHEKRILGIARKLQHGVLYTDTHSWDRLRRSTAASELKALPGLRIVVTADEPDRGERREHGRIHRCRASDTFYIQFSSGSTGEPKGIVLTHENVMANIRAAATMAQFSAEDVGLSWMPLTHDMGLVGMHLMLMTNTTPQNFMPPDLFVRRPWLWMDFAARRRATITTTPNSGLYLFLNVLSDRDVTQWDLSSLRLVFNGAEPISRSLCDEFTTRLAPAGLSPRAMYPVYGLAEASLAVSFPTLGSTYHSLHVDRGSVGIGRVPAQVRPRDAGAIELMAVGKPLASSEIRFADEHDKPMPNCCVGHLQLRGKSITVGYHQDGGANARLFTQDGWLRTGDVGFLMEGELFIAGRANDKIVIHGQNYFPHDLEAIAQRAPGVRLNKVVVAGCRFRDSRTDELVVFALHRGSLSDFIPVIEAVERLMVEHAGLSVRHVIPVRRIPRTTSGKLQRRALVEKVITGDYAKDIQELDRLRLGKSTDESRTLQSQALTRRILSICNSILDDGVAGEYDNVFEIGVSSIQLVAIHHRIDREFPGLLRPKEMFDYPTAASLSTELQLRLKAAMHRS